MLHLELTYRPLSAECVRGTYIIIELVLSVSFNSPRLNAVMGYTKVIRRESSSFQKQAKFINRSLHNSSLCFHLGTPNQTFLAGENFDNPTERPRVARWIFRADLQRSDVHFCLLWSRSRYSLNHRFQKVAARYCTCLHLRRDKESSFWNNPGGIWGSDCKRSKWLGVKSSGSCESLETILRVVTHMGVKYPLDILL